MGGKKEVVEKNCSLVVGQSKKGVTLSVGGRWKKWRAKMKAQGKGKAKVLSGRKDIAIWIKRTSLLQGQMQLWDVPIRRLEIVRLRHMATSRFGKRYDCPSC